MLSDSELAPVRPYRTFHPPRQFSADAWMFSHPHIELLTRLNIASTFDTSMARRTIEALDDASSELESLKHRFRIVVLGTVMVLLGPQLSGISSQGNVIVMLLPPLLHLRTALFSISNPNAVHQQTTTTNVAPRTRSVPTRHTEMTMFMRLPRDAAQKPGLCIFVGIPFISPFPTLFTPTISGNRVRSSPMLMRVYHTVTGVERRNDGESPGPAALDPSFTFMTDATLWLARSLEQDHEVLTTEVLRSRISMRSCLYHGTASC